MPSKILRTLLVTTGLAAVAGCAMMTPPPAPSALERRLAAFPTEAAGLRQPVTVRWNAYQVPYIEAQTDTDAAHALGLVHAHLRLGQLEVAKRVARGRISEMVGPFVMDIDAGLKTLDYGRAADAILAALPEETRDWLNAYVAGINAYKARTPDPALPHEYRTLNLDPAEPWTAKDSIALGRLAGTDVNWLAWFRLLRQSGMPDFDRTFRAAVEDGLESTPSLSEAGSDLGPLAEILDGMSRSGSNSVVVAPEKSATGAGLIASDPHLGFLIPNAWILIGLKSPSYHVVGMMPPGIPAFGFGRTPHIAWGGTNLRGLSSDLVDVDGLPAESFATEEETLAVRAWFDRTVRKRQTPYGPVISDAEIVPNPLGKDLAVRWMGHQVSDEITALLKVSRARDWDDFVAALKTFSIPGQNFLYVDVAGHIGHAVAAHLPTRPPEHRDSLFVAPEISDRAWSHVRDVDTLPRSVDPKKGYLASANNKPAETAYPIGYFFPPDERFRRLEQMLAAKDKVSLTDLIALQRDAVSLNSLALVERLRVLPTEGLDPAAADALSRLAAWDGAFDEQSDEAVLFVAVVEGLLEELPADPDLKGRLDAVRGRPQVLTVLATYLEKTPAQAWESRVSAALARATERARGRTWGEVHRLRLKSFLGRLPLIGDRYVLGEYPVRGSLETVHKAAHPMTAEPHETTYGTQSRHISDMGDPDANHFVLVGGNDGWIGSANANDMTPLWLDGRYVQMPLTETGRHDLFPHVVRVAPE